MKVWVASPEPAVGVFTTSRNLSRSPSASLRDRLRCPLTEPVCRMVWQLSGSGEGPGPGRGAAGLPEAGSEMAARIRASRCHRPGDRFRSMGIYAG